jgi:hypothetical protein
MSRMKHLFTRADIFSVLEYRKDQFKKAFQNESNGELDKNAEGVIARLVEQFSINVPVLRDDEKYAKTRETQVDVSRYPNRIFFNHGPHYVAGTEITFVIPFSGDAALFDVRPSTFTTTFPVGEIHDGELHLVYAVADAQFDVEAQAERNIGEVKSYLDYMRPSAEQLKRELESIGASLLQRRTRERREQSQLIARLKTPIRQAPQAAPAATTAPVYPPARHRASKKKREDEWDVFISHATEDKEAIARPLADNLRAKGLRVWYDEFSLQLGDSLRQSIDRGLARSLFGVVILSPHFFDKRWPQQELNGLFSREIDGEKVILPVWHNINAEEVLHNSPMLADRTAVSTEKGLEIVVQKIMQVVRPD